ncbi:MAG: hypothetical protein KKH98_00920, partial [Spirochaetes bacterium]|nr:hypothetical protein [Spirochaetota bacterium]
MEIKVKNKTVVDEKTEKPISERIWTPDKEEIKLRNFLSKRFEQMSINRSSLGIEQKWDMADRLYTPHKVRQNGNNQSIYTSSLTSKGNSSNTDDDGRESDISRPLAFEKIQTALALMIDQNPKAALRSYLKKYEAIKEFVKSVYENNWDINRLLIELKAFIFNLAKYGNAFGRRYYKKTFRTDHQIDEQGNVKKSKVIDFDDVIFENLDPRQVYLDEKCSNARNARDGFIEYMFDYDDFFDSFDEKEHPNIYFVKAGIYLETKNSNEFKVGAFRKINTKEVQVLLYENRKRHEMHLLANG